MASTKMGQHYTTLVQLAFAQLTPDAGRFADLLYARLFQLDPSLRGMFANDLRAQKAMLLDALSRVVRNLDQPEQMLPALAQLGRLHEDLGIAAQHYATFGAALLWTLEISLGEDFTPEMRAAWSEFYGLLASAMQGAGTLQGSIIENAGVLSSSGAPPRA